MEQLIKTKPVASFFYKGSHSHPVKRTVLLTESDNSVLKGYEVREGVEVRDADDAPIKTFCRDKIATYGQTRNGSKLNKNKQSESTLVRMSMSQAEETGW